MRRRWFRNPHSLTHPLGATTDGEHRIQNTLGLWRKECPPGVAKSWFLSSVRGEEPVGRMGLEATVFDRPTDREVIQALVGAVLLDPAGQDQVNCRARRKAGVTQVKSVPCLFTISWRRISKPTLQFPGRTTADPRPMFHPPL